MSRQPTVFIAHGAPPLLDDAGWMSELASWGQVLGKPRAVLMFSAHWEAPSLTIGATTPVPLVYDFYGFPEHYYRLQYPAPGAPWLATRIRELVGASNVTDDPKRGLDHGTYVPLMAMYPHADVPVLQVALPSLEPKTLFELGQRLAPLRDEGVLIAGSGFITHNLRAVAWHGGPPQPWAVEFDTWVSDALERRDVAALFDYRQKAPGVRIALPTHEHFVPLFIALGAAADERVTSPISGFWLGSMTRRSLQWGASP